MIARVLSAFLCTTLVAGLARAEPAVAVAVDRLAVIVGSNLGDARDEPLRYAERDAEAVSQLLIELGQVRASRALLVLGGGPVEVLQAIHEARGRAAELSSRGSQVLFTFYYSGHGDDESLHLARGHLALADLRRELAAVSSTVTVSLFDACRSATRYKGAHRGGAAQFDVHADPIHGSVELWASSPGEVAQESEELGGAVFTHYVLSALRGGADFDADGRVTLDELYAYASRHTTWQTELSLAAQHPALSARLAGAGEVELTRLMSSAATLELPPGGDRYLVFAWPTAATLAEVAGSGPRRLALPAGRYMVTERRGEQFSVARAELAWGGQTRLTQRDFRAVSREELVARGGQLELRPYSIAAIAVGEWSPTGAAPLRAGVDVGAQWTRGALALRLELGVRAGAGSRAAFVAQEEALRGAAYVGGRLFTRRLELIGGVGAELRWMWQQLERADAAQLAGTPLLTRYSHSAGGLGPRALVELVIPLRRRASLLVAASFTALFVPLYRAAQETPQLGWYPLLTLGAGARF